jgi:hypothetical protein
MSGVIDAAGPITEVLTWFCLPLGILLLLAVAILRRSHSPWKAAKAVVFKDETGAGYRWFDHEYQVHNAPLSPHDVKDMAAGDEVSIYYELNNPSRWRTEKPGNSVETALLVGRLLSVVGTAALLSGFVLPLL